MKENLQVNSLNNKEGFFHHHLAQSPSALIEFYRTADRAHAFEKLSLNKRRVLTLKYVEGLNERQIGDTLSISHQAVNQHLNTAPEMLFKIMSKNFSPISSGVTFKEILLAYANYRLEKEAPKK